MRKIIAGQYQPFFCAMELFYINQVLNAIHSGYAQSYPQKMCRTFSPDFIAGVY